MVTVQGGSSAEERRMQATLLENVEWQLVEEKKLTDALHNRLTATLQEIDSAVSGTERTVTPAGPRLSSTLLSNDFLPKIARESTDEGNQNVQTLDHGDHNIFKDYPEYDSKQYKRQIKPVVENENTVVLTTARDNEIDDPPHIDWRDAMRRLMSENENPTMKILKGDRHLLEIEGGNAIERIAEERASMQLQIDMLETEVAVLANSASTAQRHIKDLRPVGEENLIQ